MVKRKRLQSRVIIYLTYFTPLLVKTEMDFDEVTASPALNHRDKLDLNLE